MVWNTSIIHRKYVLNYIRSRVLYGFSAHICRHPKVSNSVDEYQCLWEALVFFLVRINCWAFSIAIRLVMIRIFSLFVTALLNILFYKRCLFCSSQSSLFLCSRKPLKHTLNCQHSAGPTSCLQGKKHVLLGQSLEESVRQRGEKGTESEKV